MRGGVFNSIQTRFPGGPLIAADAYGEGNGWQLTGVLQWTGFLAGSIDRRYLQILADPRDGVQRRIILKLLAEEEAILREAPLDEKGVA